MRLTDHEMMQRMDLRAIHELGIPSLVLMENAARSAFEALQPLLELDSKIFLFLGPGNNGGDGYALARICKNHGWETAAICLAPPQTADCRKMAEIYAHFGQILDFETFQAEAPSLAEQDLVIDCLFGTGLQRPLEGEWAQRLEWINGLSGIKVALDLPSGVSASTGDAPGAAFRAQVTIALATAKLGHYLQPGKELRGGLVVKPISVPEDYEPTDKEYHLINEELVCGHLVPLDQQTYKHRQGHLALLCGQKGMLGAALLAGRASLRSGCGLATLCLPESELSALVHEAPELMTRAREKAKGAWLEDYQALVIGCGLGRSQVDWKKYLGWMKKAKTPTLLDADAFHGLSSLKGLALDQLVVTPHQGEFCHFMQLPLPKNNGERIEQGRAFVKRHPCVLVLKGAPTLVFSPQGAIYVNETGNAGLATAGTGDVLAGLIGGFLAQGYEPLPASLLGVWLHGFAAELYAQEQAQESLTSTELIGYLGRAMAHLQASLD